MAAVEVKNPEAACTVVKKKYNKKGYDLICAEVADDKEKIPEQCCFNFT